MIKTIHDSEGKLSGIYLLINGIYYPIPFDPGSKIISFETIEYLPTRLSLQSAWEQWTADKDLSIELADIPPQDILHNPGWDNLQNRLLAGDLYLLFSRLTAVAMQNSSVSTAQAHISMAILNVRKESALAAGLALLFIAGYTLTNEEKNLWNNAISEEGFSGLVAIP